MERPESIEEDLARIEALPVEERPAALEELEQRLRLVLDEDDRPE